MSKRSDIKWVQQVSEAYIFHLLDIPLHKKVVNIAVEYCCIKAELLHYSYFPLLTSQFYAIFNIFGLPVFIF